MSPAKHYRTCAALATTVALAVLAGCGKNQAAAPATTVQPVTVATMHRTSVPVNIELPGRTSAYLVAQVRARVDGIVLRRGFQEGADVRVGQSLYQIDPAPYRVALKSAEASQQKAESNLIAMNLQAERYKILAGGKAISKQAYDNAVAAQGQAEADVAAAKAAVANARINLGYTAVTAPISGRSSGSLVTQGAYVQGSAATLLTTIQQIDPIYVDLNESSTAGLQLRRDIASGKIRPNDTSAVKVSLTLEDGTTYEQPGKLQYNGITVDQTTGSVTVRATFANPKGVLLPGMFVHASIQQGVNDNAFLVPVSAVTHNAQGEATVMTVDGAGKTIAKLIQTGATEGPNWVVTGGLKDGDRVIVSGWQKVQPGMQVAATEMNAPNSPSVK
ncbi:efflux RND transporter periplasmic adaptor subunit [Herbaspirillum sp. WKF16]|uniref:efflux RND transporter periplasmic adaptor subunit n=1 Tax=Herbaspirillum sp. WKF16 TaxID=3028312 RepID=UPI0023A92EF1|nr:efflux RND transporter periplasmic adaptor subunit [Herbaspirillum sp. WKF16]WDZ95813.1 efflux RND transporter periplasmic adaptor subunit [Herbaspirillum sp. WKF16]